MDSGNSDSLQSSSGDEEFDSRADAISAFMNNRAAAGPAHVGPISSNPQPPHQQTTTNSASIFDHPLSNYFDPISRPPPPSQQPHQTPTPTAILNLDMPWSETLRSDHPNCTEIINSNMLASSSSSLHSLFGSQPQLQPHGLSSFTATQKQSPAVSITPVPENTSATNTPRAASDQTHVVRNPKKRSRASRRAPTTVLTTDTTNFRAMVQEFTGIPAPPFTSPPFSRSRLDLYGTPSSMRSNPLDVSQQPPYLRRPFPQKVQLPPQFLASSSSSLFSSSVIDHAIASSNSTNNVTSGLNINASPNATASLNYEIPSELGLLKQSPPPQSSTLFNMPNPLLTSLLQSNTAKFSPSNSSILGSKTSQGSLEIPSNDSPLKMGVLDEFDLSHGQVNTSTLSGLPRLISSDHQTASRNDNNPVGWGNGMGSSDNDNQSQVRSGNGNFNFSRNAANGKLNYSASSSTFHGDKGSDSVNASRGEGMMESWIYSSE